MTRDSKNNVFSDLSMDHENFNEKYTIFLQKISQCITESNASLLKEYIKDLHVVEVADIVNLLSSEQRKNFITLLDVDLDPLVFPEIDKSTLETFLEYIPKEQLVFILRSLPSEDAVYIIETLEKDYQLQLLSSIPVYERRLLERSLEYPEDSAGRLMGFDFVAIPEYWSIGSAIDYLRDIEHLPQDFNEIFVVDTGFRLLGVLSLSRLLRNKRPVMIRDIMDDTFISVNDNEDKEEVAYRFSQFHIISAPVINEKRRLIGVIRVEDAVEVIEQEVEEDIQLMAGVNDEAITDNFFEVLKNRLTWLVVNLFTAILASLVISFFDEVLSKNIALAILMPIVASMGGNGATQTMTIAVRALAKKDLLSYNLPRAIKKEVLVGIGNGLVLSIVMAGVTWLWFGSSFLAMIIFFAMIVNMFIAGLSGILLPVVLNRYNVDPAVASGVLVTTITDVLGFGIFLGLATLFI